MIYNLFLTLGIISFSIIFTLYFFDNRKKKKQKSRPKISFIITCYNSEDSIQDTIKSVFDSYKHSEVIVVNDASTDNSLAKIKEIQNKYNFILFNNEQNKGKSESINYVVPYASSKILFIVDSDTIITRDNVKDIIAWFDSDKNIKAVSCPYRPKNSGLIPSMLEIEYQSMAIYKSAYNFQSCLALWGGCLAVKRDIFEELGGFRANRLIEDVDLALRIRKKGYKVVQSNVFVKSGVPSKPVKWWKQKKRWNAGGIQCFIDHPSVYFTSPIYLLTLMTFILLLISLFMNIYSLGFEIYVTKNMVTHLHSLNISPYRIARSIFYIYKPMVIKKMFQSFGLILFTLPYVILTIRKWGSIYKVFYAIPYSFIYYPVLTASYFYGVFIGIKDYKKMARAERAW